MKKTKLVLIGLSVILIAIIAIFVFQPKEKEKPFEIEWTMNTIQVEDGWGFIISMNGKPTIKQNRIPAIDKKIAFSSEESAKIIGEIMLTRIKNNASPSISKSKLMELGIIDSLEMPILQK